MPRFLVLVEGRDDAYVLQNLAARREYSLPLVYGKIDDEDTQIALESRNGIEDVLNDVAVRLKGRGSGNLERLGIVVDADRDPRDRWRLIRATLLVAGYEKSNVAEQLVPGGAVVEQPEKPTVGVWLMPNNLLAGELEDFLSALVPEQDQLWPLAVGCVDDIALKIPATDRFPDAKKSKAYMHTWLAWQKEPGFPLGFALTKRYLDPNAAQAREMMDWFRRLFNL